MRDCTIAVITKVVLGQAKQHAGHFSSASRLFLPEAVVSPWFRGAISLVPENFSTAAKRCQDAVASSWQEIIYMKKSTEMPRQDG